MTTFVATVPEGDKNKSMYPFLTLLYAQRLTLSLVFIVRTIIPVANGISGTTSSSACGLALPNGATVVDIKFLDDSSLLVLSQLKG